MAANSATPPEDSDSLPDNHFAPQAARHDGPFNDVDRELEHERQHGGGNGAGENQGDIVQADAPQNRLPQAAGADDRAQRQQLTFCTAAVRIPASTVGKAIGSSMATSRVSGPRPRTVADSIVPRGMPSRPV